MGALARSIFVRITHLGFFNLGFHNALQIGNRSERLVRYGCLSRTTCGANV